MASKVRKLADDIKKKLVKDVKPPDDRRRSRTIKVPEDFSYSSRPAERKRKYRIEEELLRACIAEGMSREDILNLMDLREDELAKIEKRLLANDGQRALTLASAHRYYIYCLQQEQCIRDLDFFVEASYQSIKNWNDAAAEYKNPALARKALGTIPSNQGAILAIKAKSEILDRTIKMGQDMGIIQKRAKEVRVSGQLNLAALPTEKLRVVLEKKLNQFDELVSKGSLPKTYINMLEGKKDDEREYISGESEQSESDTCTSVNEKSA